MWTIKLLKTNALRALHGRYWRCFGISVLAAMLGGSTMFPAMAVSWTQVTGWLQSLARPAVWMGNNTQSEFDRAIYLLLRLGLWPVLAAILLGIAVVAVVYAAFVGGPAQAGFCRYMLEVRQGDSRVGTLFSTFRTPYGSVVRAQFLAGVKIAVGCVLFVIPGVVLSYRYRMVPCLMAENPYLSASRAMQLSSQMMQGEKWHAFLLDLSFLGWRLLCVLTFGLGFAFLEPYYQATCAELYALLRAKAFAYGITDESELGGFMRYDVENLDACEPQKNL